MAQPDEPAPVEEARRAGVDDRDGARHPAPEPRVVRLAIRPSFQSFPALVHDVSATGIGFLLDRPLESGTVLALQLRGERPGASFIRMARVVHARRHLPVKNAPWVKKKPFFQNLLTFLGSGSSAKKPEDFIWLIGCQLSPPLSPAELELLS